MQPSSLPVQLTPFIGREEEIATLGRLLAGTRLLTLTGAGGSGKSRLALEVAARMEQEGGGPLAWVELAPLTDPALLPQHLAASLGVREEGGITAADALVAALRSRPLLLLLDNCEHLVEECAALADSLLRGCPTLRILATSREALGVAGERAWLVPPLTLPPPGKELTVERLLAFEAVQLFVARAQDVVPRFTLEQTNAAAVARICRRLDGLPLAVELAAARVRVLAPQQIAERLDDAFGLLVSATRTSLPRHRTLHATIDWSYRLLTEPEQLLLQRLSVFSGGLSLTAAENVGGGGALGPWDVLDLLARLVDRSLVVMEGRDGEARYRLLETVRQFAGDRLRRQDGADSGPLQHAHEVERRHALFYAVLAEEASARLHGPGQLETLAAIELEHDNLRAALAWSLVQPDAGLALRLCSALREFWRMRGHLSEGRRWMREALALPAPTDALRARVLVGAAELARLQGDHATARNELTAAEAIARQVADPVALAQALTGLGVQLVLQRDLAAARARFDEALALHRELETSRGLTIALGGRASVALAEGDPELARALRAEAADVARGAGDRESEAHALLGLGELARQQDDYATAGSCYRHSLRLLRDVGDPYHTGIALHNLAWVAVGTGELDEAVRLFTEGLHLETAVGSHEGPAFDLAGFAAVLQARGHAEVAALALAAAHARLAAMGINPPPADAREWERVRASIRSSLGEQAFDRIWSAQRTADLAAVLEQVHETLGITRTTDDAEPAASARAPAAPSPTGPRPTTSDSQLRVLALGPLEIHVAGEPVPPEAWRYSRPKELLLFLLCHPEGRTREQIGVVFWPESSAAQVKNSFHVTLHHLRKVLGHNDWVVLEDDRYRINPALHREFDTDVFEQRISQALRDARAGAGSADALRAALALYRGDFLQDETVGDWHFETRDHLGSLYVQGLCALGELLMRAEEWAEATAIYRRVVVKEDLREDAHRNLMLCLARTGDRGRALRHYETLVALLREELDAEPEEETMALYERLKQAAVV